MGRVSLIDVLEGPRRFHYRLVSTRVTEHFGYEMTGKLLDDMPEREMRAYAERFYAATLARRLPLYHRDEALLDGRRWSHESLALPPSSDGQAIDRLMVYRVTGAPARVATTK